MVIKIWLTALVISMLSVFGVFAQDTDVDVTPEVTVTVTPETTPEIPVVVVEPETPVVVVLPPDYNGVWILIGAAIGLGYMFIRTRNLEQTLKTLTDNREAMERLEKWYSEIDPEQLAVLESLAKLLYTIKGLTPTNVDDELYTLWQDVSVPGVPERGTEEESAKPE